MVEVDARGKGEWKARGDEYEAREGRYCEPSNSGLQSTGRAVAARLTKLLNSLDVEYVSSGELVGYLREMRLKIHNELLADGWRVYAPESGGWKVLPPNGKRNDNAELWAKIDAAKGVTPCTS